MVMLILVVYFAMVNVTYVHSIYCESDRKYIYRYLIAIYSVISDTILKIDAKRFVYTIL